MGSPGTATAGQQWWDKANLCPLMGVLQQLDLRGQVSIL